MTLPTFYAILITLNLLFIIGLIDKPREPISRAVAIMCVLLDLPLIIFLFSL